MEGLVHAETQKPPGFFSRREIRAYLRIFAAEVSLEKREEHIVEIIEEIVQGLCKKTSTSERRKLLEEIRQFGCLTEEGLNHSADAIHAFIREHLDTPLEEFEQDGRESFEEKGFQKINDFLYVEKSRDLIYLHLAPLWGKSQAEKFRLLFEGMRILAQQVDEALKNGETLTRVVGRSWIAASAPKALERLGFTIKEAGASEPEAFISVSDLLGRYLLKP